MLDLKFYDIPQTVKLAVSQLGQRGVTFATVHGNEPIVRAAAQAGAQGIKILAVTVLTSFNNDDMTNFFGFGGKVEDLVLEALRLRKELGEDFLIVTPGIRPAVGEAGDQKRVVTPGRAIADGADHVVVGRPVRDAPSPLAVIQSMLEDIEEALSRFS
jgi:orotidine-5'-phosphate decarboxylase